MNKKQRTDMSSFATDAEESDAVLKRHLSAFQENNLADLMADYSNESVLITPDKTYEGIEEIRGYLADLMVHFPKQASSIEVTRIFIRDNLIYITWRGKSQTVEVSFATDTFVVKDEKIMVQTFAGLIRFSN